MPQNRMHQLIPYKDLLNMKQKKDVLNALQMEKAFHIKPTKTQTGGFLGSLLASIGIHLFIYLFIYFYLFIYIHYLYRNSSSA